MKINQQRKKIKNRKNINLPVAIHRVVKANQRALIPPVFHKQNKRINKNNIKGKRLRKIIQNKLKTKKMFLHKVVTQILDLMMESLLQKKH